MDMLDRIVREVEMDLLKWCKQPLLHEAPQAEEEEATLTESSTSARTPRSEIDESGTQHQRCGGGRRIIRRSHGAS